MPEIKVITTLQGVVDSRDAVLASRSLGCDIETANYKDSAKAFDPLKCDIRLLQVSPSREQCFVYDLQKINPLASEFDFLRDMIADQRVRKIFHNGNFDLRFLFKHFGLRCVESLFDTYLASVLIAGEAVGGDDEFVVQNKSNQLRHGLADVAQRFAFVRVDKLQQTSNFSGELSREQILYSAIDALVMHDVCDGVNQTLEAADLRRVANCEFDAVESIARIENVGFFLDGEAWLAQCAKDEQRKAELEAKLLEQFSSVKGTNLFGEVSMNLDSHEELSDALKALGIELPDSTRAYKLKPLVEKWPIIQDVIDYREAAQAVKTFGREYMRFVHSADGRIHAEFRQIGAPTGRMSCSNPNLQQIPSEAEYRKCFRAKGPDRTLIVADYSMIELRLLGEFSRDERLLEAFTNNIDLHSYTASFVFNKPIEDCGKGSANRRLGKDLNFGTVYDISAQRFALNTGQTEAAADKQLKAFFATYPQLDDYLRRAATQAQDEREARTHGNRTHNLSYDENNLKDKSLIGRNGRNTPIQGSCSDIFKRALYLFNRSGVRERASVDIVHVVHDEIVVECDRDEAHEVAGILEREMKSAAEEVLQFVPVKVDADISDHWEKG